MQLVRKFGTNWIQIIPKLQSYIHDSNSSLFLPAVAEFKLSRLALPHRNFVNDFMMRVKIVGFDWIQLLENLFFQNCSVYSETGGEQFLLW